MDYEDVKKSLWHAFDMLDNSATVKISRCRVLTNNLGHMLGVDKAETVWDKVKEELVDFDLFFSTLQASLLVGLDKNSNPLVPALRAQLDNLCWMLCEKAYLQRIRQDPDNNNGSAKGEDDTTVEGEGMKKREFSKNDLFKLWKVFNFLCERADSGEATFPLRIDVEETDRIANEICTTLGLPFPSNISENRKDGLFLMDFCQFVRHLADLVDNDESNDNISHGISEVHGQIVSDVVRKGYMVKFGNKVTAWKERWFVLTASSLRYFVSSDEKECKGTIIMCSECFTQSFPDKPGGKHHRLKLHTPNKQYELSAPDLKSKNMWMSDIRRVVGHIGVHKDSLQLIALKERKREREERRRKIAQEECNRRADKEALEERQRQLEELEKKKEEVEAEVEDRERLLEEEKRSRLEEEERRQKEMDELMAQKRQEIDAEKQRCQETECRLQAERAELMKESQEALEAERAEREAQVERLRAEEAELAREKEVLQQRLSELEEAKQMLEKAVEDERALKRDEEIVRNLQAKMLEEEFKKRAELEQLRDEQRRQLVEEQLSRQELQEAHRKQEEELRYKEEQLGTLISDRKEADGKLQDTSDRLKQAEVDRQRLEERLKLKEMSSSSALAKPLSTPNPNPFVTHRGQGAFSDADFTHGCRSPLHVLHPNHSNHPNHPDDHKENQAPLTDVADSTDQIVHSVKLEETMVDDK